MNTCTPYNRVAVDFPSDHTDLSTDDAHHAYPFADAAAPQVEIVIAHG